MIIWRGDDYQAGDSGNDTYVLHRGCGKDTIYDGYGVNTLKFTDDVTPEDIEVYTSGTYDVVIKLKGSEDEILLREFRWRSGYRNFELSFSDGRIATFDIANMCLIYDPVEKEVASDLDTLSQENAQSLADIMAEGDTTNDAEAGTVQSDLSLVLSEDESVDACTDIQAGLLAQELSSLSTDNNVFTTDGTTAVEQTQLFTEQYVVE